MENKCEACHKTYSTKQNLAMHYSRQPLCKIWIDNINPDIKEVVESKINTKKDDKDTRCPACKKSFSNVSNVNKHIENNLTCKKWIAYQDLKTHSRLFKEEYILFDKEIKPCNEVQYIEEHGNSVLPGKIAYKSGANSIEESFEAPKHKLCHIIWNVFLIDKETKVTQEILDENNIKYIIGILPDETIYNEKVKVNVAHSIMKYAGQNMTLDTRRFDEECKKIEEYRERRENVFVFCNNGYQRSIPFLCHYLIKHHRNEVPNVERAIDIILPQVDKENFAKLRRRFIQQVEELFSFNS